MPNGCAKCWAEFKGWCKAFTPIESLLTFLEAVLLVLLLLFLIFVILHFFACRGRLSEDESEASTTARFDSTTATSEAVTTSISRPTCTVPSKTIKTMHLTSASSSVKASIEPLESDGVYDTDISLETDDVSLLAPDETDGELASDDERQVVMALVKVKPGGLTFGCTVTVLSEYWTATAASCIDSIEEVDSLDNFVIVDSYGEANKGRSHAVVDVRVHPLYEGRNRSFDLALLKAGDALRRSPARLPSLLEYFNMTMGETAEVLGFGHFRTLDHSVTGQRVHSAFVHVLPVKHCFPPNFASRNLVPLKPVAHGRCGLAPMCLGVLYSRGTPCNFCAGAPLLRGRTLLGVMADSDQCGAACEPALYVNMAAVGDWLALVLAQ